MCTHPDLSPEVLEPSTAAEKPPKSVTQAMCGEREQGSCSSTTTAFLHAEHAHASVKVTPSPSASNVNGMHDWYMHVVVCLVARRWLFCMP